MGNQEVHKPSGIRSKVNPIKLFLFLLPFIIVLSIYLINWLSMPNLELNIKCAEYVWDGETEDGESTSGEGTLITLDGKLTYNSSIESDFDYLNADITVFDVSGRKFNEKIRIRLSSSGVSTLKKEIDFENSFYCFDHRYSISFYSPDGIIIPHRGDYESSINNPLYSGLTPTPNLTTEAIVNSAISSAEAMYNATQQSVP